MYIFFVITIDNYKMALVHNPGPAAMKYLLRKHGKSIFKIYEVLRSFGTLGKSLIAWLPMDVRDRGSK
jgi:hypothetical protein